MEITLAELKSSLAHFLAEFCTEAKISPDDLEAKTGLSWTDCQQIINGRADTLPLEMVFEVILSVGYDIDLDIAKRDWVTVGNMSLNSVAD